MPHRKIWSGTHASVFEIVLVLMSRMSWLNLPLRLDLVLQTEKVYTWRNSECFLTYRCLFSDIVFQRLFFRDNHFREATISL
jgi:hypothetical protein